ncbi:MAG: nucleotidyltransferase domain-containing protein [Anaerolineae bacterium]|nr:nucleotidyltransferase domain-containing protein [Anaerolineae bacterium]
MRQHKDAFESRLFTVEERDRIQARILEIAHADRRIVAGALLGSLAKGAGDQWSDLDLSFGLATGTDIHAVLDDWSGHMGREFDAAVLFDLPRLTSIYRVFMLPNNLQVDLSFTPETDFGALGPKFPLLFGKAVEREQFAPPKPAQLFGLAVHHAVRARICVERERLWQAEYWITELRREALALACHRLGFETNEARGFDKLPAELLQRTGDTLVRSVDRTELLRALGAGVELLLSESSQVPDVAAQVQAQLRGLTG